VGDVGGETDKRHWLVTFPSAAQAVKAYDIMSLRHQGADAKRNFEFRQPWPVDVPVNDYYMAGHHEMRDNREAREKLEVGRADGKYMEELRPSIRSTSRKRDFPSSATRRGRQTEPGLSLRRSYTSTPMIAQGSSEYVFCDLIKFTYV
jgi:hypothetical protein